METNLNKNDEQIDMQLHNARINAFCELYDLSMEEAESAIDLLDNNLGYGYTADVIALALRNEVQISSQSIRLIKIGKYKNQKVFDFLLEVAATNKSDGDKAQKKIKNHLTT